MISDITVSILLSRTAWATAGDALLHAQLRAAFEASRRRVLSGAVELETLSADVSEMRLRMRRELSKAGAGQFDIKQGAGGIADIEFLVQYWVLEAAARHPCLLDHSDNIRQLEGLAAVVWHLLVSHPALAMSQGHWEQLAAGPAQAAE